MHIKTRSPLLNDIIPGSLNLSALENISTAIRQESSLIIVGVSGGRGYKMAATTRLLNFIRHSSSLRPTVSRATTIQQQIRWYCVKFDDKYYEKVRNNPSHLLTVSNNY